MSSRKRARPHEYELGHSDRELKRPRLQARLVDPLTRQFFADAGLKPGMRVLDVGSGGGDTALLAEEVVGAKGEIVGVDQSPAAVAAAENRIAAAGKRNISFRHGELDRLELGETFADAAVGRYVLMFNPDPAAMLRSVARLVRAGGPIVFHETDWNGIRSNPAAPIYDECHAWIVRTFKRLGTNPYMGHELHAAFVRAALPPPTMELSALIQGPTEQIAYVEMIAELAITMAPAMEKEGIVAPGEIDPAILSATNARGSRTARECRNRTLRDWRLVAQAVRPRRDKILGDPLSANEPRPRPGRARAYKRFIRRRRHRGAPHESRRIGLQARRLAPAFRGLGRRLSASSALRGVA